MTENASTRSTAQLSLFDTVNLVIGIVVGVAIFKAPGTVFRNVEYPSHGLAAWLVGGVLSMMGALCFAELAATYPQSGGAYVYLRRAFGPAVSFLFGWGQLVAMITGTIGALAFVFADYAIDVFNIDARYGAVLAASSVVVLTATNLAGVETGKTTQNLLTLAKLAGLLAIAVSGLAMPSVANATESLRLEGSDVGFAMILVLYAYGGWSDAAYVTAEVRDRQKNIALALILGVAAITVAYILVNLALLRGLGFEGLRSSEVPATDLLRVNWGANAGKIMGAIVIISALGANNGVIFTGARVYVSLGSDHNIFRKLATWNARQTAPTWSLLAQATISLALITAVGTSTGQRTIDVIFGAIGVGALPWSRFGGGFDMLLAATAPVFWLFLLLTIAAMFVLRWREPTIERPFRVPFYPLPPLIFIATCGYMLYASVAYAGRLTALGLLPLALGGGVYLAERRLRPQE